MFKYVFKPGLRRRTVDEFRHQLASDRVFRFPLTVEIQQFSRREGVRVPGGEDAAFAVEIYDFCVVG